MSAIGSSPDAVWAWVFEDGEGHEVVPSSEELTPPRDGFAARSDAETWVGERWRALVAAGAEVGHLCLGGDVVGAPLALRPTA